MMANDSIPQLQLEARRLHQALGNTATGTPAFEQVGQLLGQKIAALQQAQQEVLTAHPLR